MQDSGRSRGERDSVEALNSCFEESIPRMVLPEGKHRDSIHGGLQWKLTAQDDEKKVAQRLKTFMALSVVTNLKAELRRRQLEGGWRILLHTFLDELSFSCQNSAAMSMS